MCATYVVVASQQSVECPLQAAYRSLQVAVRNGGGRQDLSVKGMHLLHDLTDRALDAFKMARHELQEVGSARKPKCRPVRRLAHSLIHFRRQVAQQPARLRRMRTKLGLGAHRFTVSHRKPRPSPPGAAARRVNARPGRHLDEIAAPPLFMPSRAGVATSCYGNRPNRGNAPSRARLLLTGDRTWQKRHTTLRQGSPEVVWPNGERFYLRSGRTVQAKTVWQRRTRSPNSRGGPLGGRVHEEGRCGSRRGNRVLPCGQRQLRGYRRHDCRGLVSRLSCSHSASLRSCRVHP